MKRLALTIIMLACAVALAASVLDVRCGAVRAAPDTLVVACRAGRLSTLAGIYP